MREIIQPFKNEAGYFALHINGKLEGFYESHLNGQRPEEVFRKDLFKHWWKLNTGDRGGCMQTLIEANRFGLLPEERVQWMKWWGVKDSDCYTFAKKAGITLLIHTQGYRASWYFKAVDKTVYSMGASPFIALCNLWIMINNMPELKKKVEEDGK